MGKARWLDSAWLLIAAFGVGVTSGVASRAQADEIRASMADETHWLYVPAVSGESVVGFLAIQDPVFATRGSYSVVWFERIGVAEFTMEGWTETAPDDAASIIADRLNDPSLFQYADFSASAMPLAALGAVSLYTPPEWTNNGISIYDPWQSVSDELNAEDIEFLVNNGFATGAAGMSKSVVMPAPCSSFVTTQNGKLAKFAADFELNVFGAVSGSSVLPESLETCCLVPQGCSTIYRWGEYAPPTSIASAAPSCRWTRDGTYTTTCSFCGISWSYSGTVTDNHTCSVAVAGECPPKPPCPGAYP